MKTRTFALATALSVLAVLPLAAQWPATERVDLDAIHRIKDEGLEHSKVMEIESYLTDVYGPRLTNSPDMREAATWAETTMKGWGLSNVHTEAWPFGRGWQNDRFVAMAVKPRAYPLIGFTKAWTPGTHGPVTGEAVLAVIDSEKDFDQWRGKLRGKFVLTTAMPDVPAHFEPLGRRYTDANLAELAMQPDMSKPRRRYGQTPEQREFAKKRMAFFVSEGVAALVDPGRHDGGTFIVSAGGSRDPKDPPAAPQVVLAVEHYGRIVPHAREEDPGHPADGHRQPLLRPGSRLVQHRGGDSRHRQGGRGRDARRAFDSWHGGHGRDRQRRGLGGDDGGDAHPQGEPA